MFDLQQFKIVTGGQSGVDRAALDVAIYLGIAHGGWCPRGRRAEDGVIPLAYRLRETQRRDYATRTEQNVIDSDGTLVLFCDRISGGTGLTCRLATKHRRPLQCIDLNQIPDEPEPERPVLIAWLVANNIQVLNIAGPRETNCPGIGVATERYLLGQLGGPPWSTG